ncbi:alanyl-tRNA editing protein Aarsd1 isoform X1 [Narcine bancroftii]|uniref:alanyl-tRNA editing protein Aarsd1 isoform X1 n=1 Tax=Narcine bancroftii TaxID=1343680 RepID=UPI0038312003
MQRRMKEAQNAVTFKERSAKTNDATSSCNASVFVRCLAPYLERACVRAGSAARGSLAMAFQCQKQCYLKAFETTVISCTPAELTTTFNGKDETLKGFNVILEDTLLFPEGGGQPDDRGFINDTPVLRVTRRGAEAVHFVQSPLEPLSKVQLKIDWERRFDHMQQHSGQHLLSALAESMFGFQTTSWEMGRQRSSIELDTTSMSSEQVEALEKATNEKIREHIPVNVRVISVDDPEMQQIESQDLPDDHAGPIRIIDIVGIDANMCCGTHVSNLSHLQVIKLLGTEKGKKKKTNLFFLVGNRVLKYAEKSLTVEKALTSLLKNGPAQHVEAVERLQKSAKLLQKNNQNLLRDLALLTAKTFKNDANKGKLFILHRKEGDNEFMNIIANEISTEVVLLFLTVGDEKGAGLFLLVGQVNAVEALGPKVAEILDGKGAGKQGRYQGRASKMSNRRKVEALLQRYVQMLDTKEE